MPKRSAVIDYGKCDPSECSPRDGVCRAAAACTRGILIQEAPHEPPFVFPPALCQGCADCSEACPRYAIRVS
jgi:translation initiation factor RLI1